jgi:hypothetical protein
MKMVGRGSRSAKKVSQRADFHRTLGPPRQQIAEPQSSMCQSPSGWKADKPGFLAPVQIAGCTSRRDSATRWKRLGERIGLATEIVSAKRAALVKFRFRSGASPHHFWCPYRAHSLERTYPGLKPRAEPLLPLRGGLTP